MKTIQFYNLILGVYTLLCFIAKLSSLQIKTIITNLTLNKNNSMDVHIMLTDNIEFANITLQIKL